MSIPLTPHDENRREDFQSSRDTDGVVRIIYTNCENALSGGTYRRGRAEGFLPHARVCHQDTLNGALGLPLKACGQDLRWQELKQGKLGPPEHRFTTEVTLGAGCREETAKDGESDHGSLKNTPRAM